MNDQTINTGDAAQDKEIAEQIKKGIEAGGMKATIKPAAGGGLTISMELPAAAKAVAAASTVSPESLKPGAFEPGGTEAYDIKMQLTEGNHENLLKFLAKTSGAGDWEEQYFIIDLVIANSLPGKLDELIAQKPDSAALYLLRGAYYTARAWMERGSGTTDQITDEMWAKARQAKDKALPDLKKAAELDAKNPVPWAFMMRANLIFTDDAAELQSAYQKTIALAPDFVQPYWAMVNVKSEKWGGSHEESLKIARAAKAAAKPGSDVYACLFYAHILVWQYMKVFENNEAGTNEYLSRPAVRDELSSTYDTWIKAPYTPHSASIPLLHYAAFWFFKTGDKARLKTAMGYINNIICPAPWSYEEGGTLVYTQAYQQAMSH